MADGVARLTVYTVATTDTDTLMDRLHEMFERDVPPMSDPKLYDWQKCSELLIRYSNSLSFLFGLLAKLSYCIRYADKKSEQHRLLMANKDVVECAVDAVKRKYDGLSRVYTIHSGESDRVRS